MITEPTNYEVTKPREPLTINSAMSLGLVCSIVMGCLWIKDGLNKNEIVQLKMSNEIAELRRDLTQRNQDMVSMNAFIRWTNAFQRENNAAGVKLIVPEPR